MELFPEYLINIETGAGTPPKFYHKFDLCLENADLNYGACYDGPLDEFSRAVGRLSMNIPPGTENFEKVEPLKWWDKFRYKFHGRMLMKITNGFRFRNLLSPLAYIHHYVLLMSTEASFSYNTGGVLTCLDNCSLSIHQETCSPYLHLRYFKSQLWSFLCRPLHSDAVYIISNTKLQVSTGFQWECREDPNDHHVQHDFVRNFPSKEIYNGEDYFSGFRSEGLDMEMSFDFEPLSDLDHSKLVLWANDYSWIRQWQMILGNPPGITRVVSMIKCSDGTYIAAPKRSIVTLGYLLQEVSQSHHHS
jgi:hypothetical protein